MIKIINTNELYHFGIKGMHWGVRRYQNADGSLTTAGKKRMYRDMYDLEGKSKKERANYKVNVDEWVKQDKKTVQEATKTASNISQNAANISRELKNVNERSMKRKNSSKERMDLSEMTDKELREKINRELLERQYNDVFNKQNESKGREYANRILEGTTSALVIAGSALAIALQIQQLKNGK